MVNYKRILILCILLLLLVAVNIAFSQPCNGPDCGSDVDNAPITGIEWLIGAGALWGLKKYHDMRKKK